MTDSSVNLTSDGLKIVADEMEGAEDSHECDKSEYGCWSDGWEEE